MKFKKNLHPNVAEQENKYLKISIHKSAQYGKIDGENTHEIKKTCGKCGGMNTKCIWWKAGATSDGAVYVQEFYCYDCETFTVYDFDDRM